MSPIQLQGLPSSPNKPRHVSYCINPQCQQRENLYGVEKCQNCGTSLLIHDRIRLIKPLRPLEQNAQSSNTEVFEVEDKGTQWNRYSGPRVMKVIASLDSKVIELLEREALVLGMLEHPGIPKVTIDDLFTFAPNNSSLELHCLVMQKFEGENLDQWLEVHGRISQALALDWLNQLVTILDQVHRSGFFHRDIKPSNIMLQPDGQLSLIDFGGAREVTNTYLAKVSRGGGTDIGTGSQYEVTVIRTACFSPLEQINGQAVPQSDFYAVGRTFAYLMTGVNLIDLPADSRTGRLIWRNKAAQIDKPLADLIDHLMAPAPGKRPQGTQVILQYLNGQLPLFLKMYRVFRSKQFRFGAIALAILTMVGGYRGGTHLVANYYFQQGLQADSENRLADAKNNYLQALQFKPQSVETYNNLALVCVQDKDYPCALQNYQQALKLKSDYWQAHQGLGSAYDDLGNYPLAEKHYRLAMQLNRNLAVDAINNLARLKNRTSDYQSGTDLAMEGLRKADDPISQAALYKNLGWAKLGLHQYAAAETALQTARELDPQRADTFCLLAKVKESQNDRVSANQFWQKCLVYDSDLPEVRDWRDQVLGRLLKP